jgi:HEAT repeat protein
LVGDPDDGVRRAALRAICELPDPRLVPVLLEALGSARTRIRAGSALVAIGDPAVDPLLSLLDDPATARPIRLEIPRLLRRIPSERAYRRLRELVTHPDEHLRLRVLGALSHLRTGVGHPPWGVSDVAEVVERELRDGYQRMAVWARAVGEQPQLLAETMRFRERRAVRRILRALELRYDRATLKLVRSSLERADRRANAIEVLDTMLGSRLRLLVLPFLDDAPDSEKVARARDLVGDVPDLESFLHAQCGDENPYVAAVAFAALAARPSDAVAARAETALGHDDPLVREAAAEALARVAPARAVELLAPVAHDPDPMVAGRVQHLLHALPDLENLHMHSTLEKVLLLKSASVFSQVPSEDLAPLARVAEEVTYEDGEVICSEGQLGSELYVVVSGQVGVTRTGQKLATLGAGEAFGEMAVLDEGPRSATVTSIGETTVLAIGSEEFYEILHEQVEIAEGVIRMLSARLREANPG